MDERQRIMEILKKHKAYLENVKDVDVALCTKGGGFFYEYNEKDNTYNVFVKFQTADELDAIIEENIATNFCTELTSIAEETSYRLSDYEWGDINPDQKFDDSDRRLLIHAFKGFYERIETAYHNLAPLKPWIEAQAKGNQE